MNITAGIAAIVVLAGAAVGLAGPAQADGFSGTFTPNGPGLNSTWVVTPCGPDCARISDSSGWSADAHPWDGVWRFVAEVPTGRSATTTACSLERSPSRSTLHEATARC